MDQLTFNFQHPLFGMLKPHIVKNFWQYHQNNPHVFELFLKYARQLKVAGREHYGTKAIIERVRWHLTVETVGDDFKLNNNYTSCYARLLTINYPGEFDHFFQFRISPGTIRGVNA